MAFKKIFTDNELEYFKKYLDGIGKAHGLIYENGEMLLMIAREQSQRGDLEYAGHIRENVKKFYEARDLLIESQHNLFKTYMQQLEAEPRNRARKPLKSITKRKCKCK